MPPIVPTTQAPADTVHFVLVPVPGSVVLGFCAVLFVFAVIELWLLCKKGIQADRE